MGTYKTSMDNHSSSYESDGGTHYHEDRTTPLECGAYAMVRKFIPKNFFRSPPHNNPKKPLAIIESGTPPVIFDEAKNKYHFFKTLYGDSHSIHFINIQNDYRLIVPYFEGCTYEKLIGQTLSHQEKIKIFLSAVIAVDDCHKKNIIIFDIKENNIIYGGEDKSFLIDGGHSQTKSSRFQLNKTSPEALQAGKVKSPHFPPEYWTPRIQIACETMDIYPLGYMLKHVLNPNSVSEREILDLIKACLNEEPSRRPSLVKLKKTLEAMLQDMKASACNEDTSHDGADTLCAYS